MDAEHFFSDAYFEQFQTKKYRNPNPLQRKQIRRLLKRVVEQALALSPTTILDAGAGEGFLTGYLAASFPDASITAIDYSADDLTRLKALFPRVETIQANVEQFDLGRSFDVVIATEVLEHLPKPGAALERLQQHGQHVIVTVPHEPWFRLTNVLRGKNLSRWGNDIEHLNHWSPYSLRRFLSRWLTVDRIETIFPWILAVGHTQT